MLVFPALEFFLHFTIFLKLPHHMNNEGPVFIYGVCYNNKNKRMWQLLNFTVGEAKMAIYLSRRNQFEGLTGTDAIMVWRRNVIHGRKP